MIIICVYFEMAAASSGIWEPFESALRQTLAAQVWAAGMSVSAVWERSDTALSRSLMAKVRVARICLSSGALDRQRNVLCVTFWLQAARLCGSAQTAYTTNRS